MNAIPVQVDVLCEAIVATGLTVTVTVNGEPTQLPGGEVGVTTNVAVRLLAVVLVNVLVRVLLPAAPDAPPVRPACLVGALHAYVVPVGTMPVGV